MAFAPFRSLAVALAGFGAVIGTALPMASSAQAAGVLDSMMSILGFNTQEEQPIEYRDRAPLVVPPKIQLPPPQVPAADRAANWPKDPDVEYRKSVNNDTKLPVNMRPDRVAPNGRVPVANAPRKPTANSGPLRVGERDTTLGESGWVSPDKMKSFSGGAKAEEPQLVAGQEPSRNYLTDPPPGLRVPSSNAAIAIPKKSLAKPAFISDQEEKDPLTPYRGKTKDPNE